MYSIAVPTRERRMTVPVDNRVVLCPFKKDHGICLRQPGGVG